MARSLLRPPSQRRSCPQLLGDHSSFLMWARRSWPTLAKPTLAKSSLICCVVCCLVLCCVVWTALPLDRPSPGPAGVSHDNQRAQTCTFERPGLQTPPKFHEKTPREGRKERILWREREKKARNFGLPTLRAPTLLAPTLRASTFSGFGPPPFGPHPSGPLLYI